MGPTSSLFWEWTLFGGRAVRATHLWPEVAATIGLLVLVSVALANGLSGRKADRARWLKLRVSLSIGFVTMGVATLGSGLYFFDEEPQAWHLVLLQLAITCASFVVACWVLWLRPPARGAWYIAIGAACALMPLLAVQSLRLGLLDWPLVAVEGSRFQHVGLEQEVTAELMYTDLHWELDRSSVSVEGSERGRRVVTFTADRYTEYARVTFVVDVGREIAAPLMPLVQGNSWTYRLESTEGAIEPRELTWEVSGHVAEGPLRYVMLTSKRAPDRRVFAHEGRTYLAERDEATPLFAAVPGDEDEEILPEDFVHIDDEDSPFLFTLFWQCRCSGYERRSPPRFEIAGPNRCSGRMSYVPRGNEVATVLATVLTAGIATAFTMRTTPATFTLTRSRQGHDPSFSIPTL